MGLTAILGLLQSKKALMAFGSVAAKAIGHFTGLDIQEILTVTGPLDVYIGGQALADHGKERRDSLEQLLGPQGAAAIRKDPQAAGQAAVEAAEVAAEREERVRKAVANAIGEQ